MQMLMSEEFDLYSTNMRLKPLIDFLTCNFDMLQRQCYPGLFQRILYILWNHFHEVKLKLVYYYFYKELIFFNKINFFLRILMSFWLV